MKETLTFISPDKEALQKWIKLYYFHATTEPSYYRELTYYPNYTSTLNIYNNSALTWTDYERQHRYQDSNGLQKLLVGKINKSRRIITEGAFHKITIVFHPLGLNHFVKVSLGELLAEHFSFFDYYGADFDKLLWQVFESLSVEEKRDLLDDFFLSRFIPFQEERLKNAVQQIIETENAIKINKLAKSVGTHRRTLLRLFQKHLAYSVEEYISVVKFRKAMITFQNQQQSLTKTAMDNNYYDQSDFIKQVKLKVGQSPKQLFADLSTLEKGLFWKYQ